MNRCALLLALPLTLPLFAAAGCESEEKKPGGGGNGNLCEPAATEVPVCTGSEKRFLVVSVLDITREDKDKKLVGFNLDCRSDASCKCAGDDNAPEGAASKCSDYTSPAGEVGIDNQFSRLDTEVGKILNLSANIKKNIIEGDLILLVQIDGIDAEAVTSTTNDDCVTVEVYLGYVPNGLPPGLSDGTLSPEQTFNLDERFFEDGDESKPVVRFGGVIENGRIKSGPATIPFSLPVGDGAVEVTIQDGRVEADFEGANLTNGLIGGILDIDQIAESVKAIPDYADLVDDIIVPVLEGFADMNAKGDDGYCSAVSAALVFDAIPAVRGSIGTRPDPADGGDEDAGDEPDGGDDE